MNSAPFSEKPPLFLPEAEPRRLKYEKTVRRFGSCSILLGFHMYSTHFFSQDRTRSFRSQPLDYIPEYLIHEPSEKRTFLPPLMHLGWILDTDRALRFVHSYGIYPTVSDERGTTPNTYDACVEALIILLDEKTGIIPNDWRIKLVFLCDGQYVPNPVEQGKINFHLGLSVGTNYDRAIPMKHIEKLGDAVAPGVKPKWYLDMDKWTWTKVSTKSSKPSSSTSSSFFSWVASVVNVPHALHHAHVIHSLRHGIRNHGSRHNRQEQVQEQVQVQEQEQEGKTPIHPCQQRYKRRCPLVVSPRSQFILICRH